MSPEPRRSGVATRGTIDRFDHACQEVGRSLARHGHTLVVTSDRQYPADRAAVEGYIEVARNGRDPAHRIELVSAAATSTQNLFEAFRRDYPAVFVPISVNTYGIEVARIRVSIEAEATILICGGAGTERTTYVALAANRKLVPIASFGGAASAVLTEMRERRFGKDSLPRALDLDVLAQD
jgi:NAD(P)-dependent dehydrogenase (short-subunit alcohol dehydrogenase family)